MSNKNQFYNTPNFVIIRVKFSEGDSKKYTYVAHVKHQIEKGDWVSVPVGPNENVFESNVGYRDIQTVQVTGITTNMKHLPKEFDVKLIISNVTRAGKTYQRFYNSKIGSL